MKNVENKGISSIANHCTSFQKPVVYADFDRYSTHFPLILPALHSQLHKSTGFLDAHALYTGRVERKEKSTKKVVNFCSKHKSHLGAL